MIIKFVEDLIANQQFLDNYCLEITSLDEVFVTIGRTFEVANGGNSENNKR